MDRMYNKSPLLREAILRIITTPEGWHAGWELKDGGIGEGWCWLRELPSAGAQTMLYEKVRACSGEEKKRIAELLKGEIVIRLTACGGGKEWALASID